MGKATPSPSYGARATEDGTAINERVVSQPTLSYQPPSGSRFSYRGREWKSILLQTVDCGTTPTSVEAL